MQMTVPRGKHQKSILEKGADTEEYLMTQQACQLQSSQLISDKATKLQSSFEHVATPSGQTSPASDHREQVNTQVVHKAKRVKKIQALI